MVGVLLSGRRDAACTARLVGVNRRLYIVYGHLLLRVLTITMQTEITTFDVPERWHNTTLGGVE